MDECPICLSELSGTVTTVGCCKKQFHTECLLRCTQLKNECPMCRVRECIVIVPEPDPDQERTQKVIAKSLMITCAGCLFLTVSIVAIKSYLNM